MPRGPDPLLTPNPPHAPAGMGPGDTNATSDANFAAAATASRPRLPAGIAATAVLDANSSPRPIDNSAAEPTRLMQLVGGGDAMAGPADDVIAVLARRAAPPPIAIACHAVPRAAPAPFVPAPFVPAPFVILQTGEPRFHGHIPPP